MIPFGVPLKSALQCGQDIRDNPLESILLYITQDRFTLLEQRGHLILAKVSSSGIILIPLISI